MVNVHFVTPFSYAEKPAHAHYVINLFDTKWLFGQLERNIKQLGDRRPNSKHVKRNCHRHKNKQ